MKRALLALALIFGLSAAFAGDEAPPPRDMVVLTVSGLIGKTNRGPFDPKRDSHAGAAEGRFQKRVRLRSRDAAVAAARTVTVTTNEFETPATFSGPLLREVLGYLEAAQVRTNFVALNGYTGWLDPDDIKSSDWILALEADGKPLGLGQQGPIWLLNTRSPDFKPNDEHHGHWVYAVFYIKVGE